MLHRTIGGVLCCGLLPGIFPAVGWAQPSSSGDAILDAMRSQATISSLDQDRISDWQQKEVDALIAGQAAADASRLFLDRMDAQFTHGGNSVEFTRQFAAQAASVARDKYSDTSLDASVARDLARALVDMARSETIPGLIAGLKSTDAAARFLCAVGLAGQNHAIGADKNLLTSVTTALRGAGHGETDPVVLSRMYLALSHPNHLGEVFDAFLDIFDQRLAFRRGPALIADGAEVDAFEFFVIPAVSSALSNDQKTQLVSRVAVFLRLDAERYNVASLKFDEQTRLERSLWLAEKILAALVDSGKDGVVKALEAKGHANRRRVLQQMHGWVGNPKTNDKGTLNDAPWNVPLGAP